MVSFVNPDKQWLGAVAGEADEEGVIQGNFYVDENIGALDGVTYEGQAQGLPYDSFKDMEGMPEEFGILTVTFQVEDQVLKTVNCEYGTGVPKDEIPQVPQKDGYYYVWEEKDLSCIKGNQKVMAEYRAWNTTIAPRMTRCLYFWRRPISIPAHPLSWKSRAAMGRRTGSGRKYGQSLRG